VADIGVDGNTRDIIRHIFFLHELAKVARVGCINAVPYTKVFKFTMVYDALLIHPTLACLQIMAQFSM